MYFPTLDDFDFSDHEWALCECFMRLEFLSEKLEAELLDALVAWRECRTMGDVAQAEMDAMVEAAVEHMHQEKPGASGIGGMSIPLAYTPGAAFAEIKEEALRLQGESAAGSLLLILDGVVQRLRHSVTVPGTGKPPRPLEFELGSLENAGYVTILIWAAGNAYRHAKDWDGLVSTNGVIDQCRHDYGNSKRTLSTLEATIGLGRVADQTACLAAIEVLTQSDEGRRAFARLWDCLNSVGRAYAEEYVDGSVSYDKVVSALDAQRSYTSLQVSFSGDERLWHAR